MHNPSYIVPSSDLRDHLLDELSTLFAKSGARISDFNLLAKSARSTQ